MALRAVKNVNNVIIADGTAEFSVANADYNGVGTWCDFEYDAYPDQTQDVKDYVAAQGRMFFALCYKVTAGAVALRTLAEIEAQPFGV